MLHVLFVKFGKYCLGNFNLVVGRRSRALGRANNKATKAEDTLVTNTFEDWDKYNLEKHIF